MADRLEEIKKLLLAGPDDDESWGDCLSSFQRDCVDWLIAEVERLQGDAKWLEKMIEVDAVAYQRRHRKLMIDAARENLHEMWQLLDDYDIAEEMVKKAEAELADRKADLDYEWQRAEDLEHQVEDLKAELTQARERIGELEDLIGEIVPSLEDWCRTTGFGETYRRDKALLERALSQSKGEICTCGTGYDPECPSTHGAEIKE